MARNGVFSQIGALFGDIGRARNAVSQYERLSALSDNALKARGLSRGDLPGFVFEKSFGGK